MEAVKTSDFLFVYGTLMSVFDKPYAVFLRKNAKLLGVATCGGYLYRVSYYPGLVLSPDAHVYGELFQINNPLNQTFWSALDEYEGVSDAGGLTGDEYLRKQIEVVYNGKPITAWTYVYRGPVNGLPIAGGRFLPK